jgi:hypothetical protein
MIGLCEPSRTSRRDAQRYILWVCGHHEGVADGTKRKTSRLLSVLFQIGHLLTFHGDVGSEPAKRGRLQMPARTLVSGIVSLPSTLTRTSTHRRCPSTNAAHTSAMRGSLWCPSTLALRSLPCHSASSSPATSPGFSRCGPEIHDAHSQAHVAQIQKWPTQVSSSLERRAYRHQLLHTDHRGCEDPLRPLLRWCRQSTGVRC